jgi:DNA-binding SARP family transcriptional activator/Tfp pilus assembly protein PilF
VIVRILGPVEVTGPDGRAVLSGRQRALVGVLALRAGTVVVPARVVEALWGDDLPRTAVKSLQSHVARVRQALRLCGLPDVLLTRGSGYALEVARSEVDACHFEDQLRSARAELGKGRWDSGAESLRNCLALWGGDPLQDGTLEGWGRAEVTRLREARLTALEDLWDAELRLGRNATEAVGELERLLVRHPLRERLVELLMVALYRNGRHLDALEAYQRLRAQLAQDLGVDPAPGLRRLHAAILRQDPELAPGTTNVVASTAREAAVHRPAQLPPRVGHFTGRAEELRRLDQLLSDTGDTRIAVVSGPGGIGKTALAVQWGHQVKTRFPDGQIFADLRGHDVEATMTPVEALTHVVRGLGVSGDQVPAELTELTGLFRSILDGKRVLILLDNAATVDQIRPLVPPTTTSALVVTSRNALTSLATYHDVHAVGLDVQSHDEALALLRSVVGADRIDREPDEAARIATLCGHLPLALRIAAAKLVGQPHSTLRRLAVEFTSGDRLDALSVDGDARSVRTVFASAYRALSPTAAQVFRLIGLHPGTTFGPQLAAAIVALPPADTDRALVELTDAYLIAQTDGDRFRLHDLIRLYANECALRLDSPPTEALARLVDWYLGVADVASRVLDRGRGQIAPTLRHPLSVVPFSPDYQNVLTFLDGERENLLPVVRLAAEQGRHDVAWQLSYLLTGFFNSRGRWADRVEICRLGLAAAQRLGDPGAEGLMRSGLGMALVVTRRLDEALDCLYPALAIARASGDRRREGHVANNIATAYARLRRFDEALEAYLEALDAHRANDDPLGIALACNNIGTAYIRLGRPELGLPQLHQALDITRRIDNPRIEAGVLSTFGEAYLSQRRLSQALAHFQQGLDIRRAIGDRRHEVDSLHQIGVTLLAQDDPAAAADQLQAALTLSQELADQHLISISLTHLATAHLHRDDLDAARECLRPALALRARSPDSYEEATIHRALSDLAARSGQRAAEAEHRERAIALFLKANATAEAAQLAPRPA